MATQDEETWDDDENTIKFLVASDVHLGYAEKDAKRGHDSLVAFEEVLQIAKKEQVDFLLLGGDLFHENKPSRKILHGCMCLLRQYCMGDRPCQLEFLSDQSVNFGHSRFPFVNYEDPNLNISLPVFSIHGNHDDPAGSGNLCALDILSAAGLVNHFGQHPSLEQVEMTPMLLQKGRTKLALYGLGSIRDERLHRMFVRKSVTMLRPRENQDEWVNVLTFHQNRVKHGEKNYIPEQFLDSFLDLVVWGHEHDARGLERNDVQDFIVLQPGSTVATSLAEGETLPKKAFLVRVKPSRKMKFEAIPLQTVRQFYLKDIVLSDTTLDPNDPEAAEKIAAFCQEKVEELLCRAEEEHTGNKRQPKEPLIRLKIEYSGGFPMFNTNRFGQVFTDRVANPREIIHFYRKKVYEKKGGGGKEKWDDEDLTTLIPREALDMSRVEDLVKRFFQEAEQNGRMSLLTEKGMGEAVKEFVDKEEKDSIQELVKWQVEKMQKHLKDRKAGEDKIEEEIHQFRQAYQQHAEEEDADIQLAFERSRSKRPADDDRSDIMDDDDDEDLSDEDRPAPTRGHGRGRGRGRGRGATTASRGRGSRGGRGGRGKKSVVTSGNIVDAMQNSSRFSQRSSAKPAARPSYMEMSDSEEEDSNGGFNAPSSSRSKQISKPRGGVSQKKGRGIAYDSEDSDEDPFTMPSAKKSRR